MMALSIPLDWGRTARRALRALAALCRGRAAQLRAARLGAARLGAGGVAALALGVLGAASAGAHSGALDEFGGHFDERTGVYHYHRPARDMALRKEEYLEWVRFPVQGILKGKVVAMAGAASLWVYVDYRPAYQEVAQQVAVTNRDDRQQRLRVDLSHVSPEETGARDKKFESGFLQRVEHALKQKLLDQPVTVHFAIVGGEDSRLRGMLFQGEAGKENVNLWMVLNGWSYYVLTDGDNKYDALFRQAEDIARRQKSGIWEHVR
jgi:endonuclease YncB( thermonuclease family)